MPNHLYRYQLACYAILLFIIQIKCVRFWNTQSTKSDNFKKSFTLYLKHFKKYFTTIQCHKFGMLKWLILLYFAFLSRQSSVCSRQSEDRAIYTFQYFGSYD